MSPAHLRVLRSEQSSGNLPGLRGLTAQKDHLQHVSPLSMVGDKPRRPRGKRLRRRMSWRDALKGLTSGSEKEGAEVPVLRMRASTGAVSRRAAFVRRGSHPPTNGNGDADDADQSSESEADFEKMREEDRPIEARVRYVYRETAGRNRESVKAREGSDGSTSTVVPEEGEGNTVGKEGKGEEPIGTRLTMTSRTGYFQDRIISPSMVCLG
jgi:hypothetical protein